MSHCEQPIHCRTSQKRKRTYEMVYNGYVIAFIKLIMQSKSVRQTDREMGGWCTCPKVCLLTVDTQHSGRRRDFILLVIIIKTASRGALVFVLTVTAGLFRNSLTMHTCAAPHTLLFFLEFLTRPLSLLSQYLPDPRPHPAGIPPISSLTSWISLVLESPWLFCLPINFVSCF